MFSANGEVVGIQNANYMFQNYTSLQSVHGLKSSSITNANYMFSNCYDISNVNTVFNDGVYDFSSLYAASYMFHNCGIYEYGFEFNGNLPKLQICRNMFSSNYDFEMTGVEGLPPLIVRRLIDDGTLIGYPTIITNLWNVVNRRKIEDDSTLYFITHLAEVSTSACSGQTLGTIYIPRNSMGLGNLSLMKFISYGWECKSNDSDDGTYFTDTLVYYCPKGHTVEITVIHESSEHLSLGSPNDISTVNGYCPDAYKDGNGWNTTVLPNITVKRIINGIGFDN
jgi:hypothetical protein